MALIKCKECGGQVSTDAKFCPHCGSRGFDTPPAAKEAISGAVSCGCMMIVGLFLLVVVVAALTAKH